MLRLIRLLTAMLFSPQPFRVKVSGRVLSPVRRRFIHFPPVEPDFSGNTVHTSHGAPTLTMIGPLPTGSVAR